MNNRRLVVVGITALVLIGAVGVTYALTRSSQEDILLESANSLGPNPFTADAVETTTTTTSTEPSGSTSTGLYGGSGNLLKCDPEKLIAFLIDPAHRDKAMAWIEIFNNDPTFRWGLNWEKSKLTIEDIPAYVHELIPGHLLVDTRFTNYGYRNGHPIPHQSLLQAGMAVLFNRRGMPEVKCYCGNGLRAPKKVDNPHWVGTCWPGCHNPPRTTTSSIVERTTITEFTTTTQPSDTTTTCPPGRDCGPSKTTTTRRPPPSTTTTTRFIDTTFPTRTTVSQTTTTQKQTTTTCSPNDPGCTRPPG